MSQSLLSKIDQAVIARDPLTISRADVARIAMEVTIAEAAAALEESASSGVYRPAAVDAFRAAAAIVRTLAAIA